MRNLESLKINKSYDDRFHCPNVHTMKKCESKYTQATELDIFLFIRRQDYVLIPCDKCGIDIDYFAKYYRCAVDNEYYHVSCAANF